VNTQSCFRAVALAALSLACSGVQRDTFVRQKAAEYVYPLPVEKVWPHVRALMDEQGYSYREDGSGRALTTEWKEEMSTSRIAASWSRYLVEARTEGTTRTAIRFIRFSRSAGGGDGALREPNQGISTPQEEPIHDPGEGQMAAVDSASRGDPDTRMGDLTRKSVSDRGANNGIRDTKFEWLLLQKVEPDVARGIEAAATSN
jgi:hypothetical protein